MSDHYILRGKKAVKASLKEWAEQFQSVDRTVAFTSVGGINVSTVFLGLDHQFGDGPPLLFETMVFGGPNDGVMERYSTWEQAEAGHAAMAAILSASEARDG